MSASELIEFAQKLDWEKWIKEDDRVRRAVGKIKKRVEGGDVDLSALPRVKLVVVGDGAVGKTCLLVTFGTGKFPEDYVPTVFDNYSSQMAYRGDQLLLQLWDTAGQEDYDRLRPLSYPGSDVVLLCFSLVSEASYEAITEKWSPEVNHYVPDCPHILVGTKLDLRDGGKPEGYDDVYEPISTERGKELAGAVGAAAYVEVSAMTGKNLQHVFETAVGLVMDKRKADGVDGGKDKKKATGDKKKKKSKK